MALFKKPSREKGDTHVAEEHMEAMNNTDDFEDELNDISYPETENDSEQEGGKEPPKRRIQVRAEEDDVDLEEDITVKKIPAVSVDKSNLNSISERKIVHAKIRLDLHGRLRIYSFKTGKSLVSIIEGWIEKHCPDV